MTKSPATIMVADDDAAIVEVVTMVLEDAGYQVLSTSNGAAVRALKTNLPDLILMDIWMSGVDGSEIVKQLKAQPETKAIPVIIFSANRDCEAIAKAAGAEDYLKKPFDIDDLLDKVARFIPAAS